MTPNWVIAKLHLPRLSRDGMSPSLCGGTGKRKSASVKFAILALTAKLTQTVPIALRTGSSAMLLKVGRHQTWETSQPFRAKI
jgi:hypothetical protein